MYTSIPSRVTNQIMQQQTYRIMFNGGYPFEVTRLPDGQVLIRSDKHWEGNFEVLETMPCLNFWVGDSPDMPMTRITGGAGLNGNSVLFETRPGKYVQISSDLIEFDWDVPIRQYVSPVGNSLVPYPWAVDDHGNVLLFCASNGKGVFFALMNSPPEFDLVRIMANQQDLVPLADPKRPERAKAAKKLMRDTRPGEPMDIYHIFWTIMGCAPNKKCRASKYIRPVRITRQVKGLQFRPRKRR